MGAKGNTHQHNTYWAQNQARVTNALERIRQFCRHTPEVGAVCGKAARTVLCGGRDENRVPTATAPPVYHAPRRRGCVAARLVFAGMREGRPVSSAGLLNLVRQVAGDNVTIPDRSVGKEVVAVADEVI